MNIVFWCGWCCKAPEYAAQGPIDYMNDSIPYLVRCHGYEEVASVSCKEILASTAPIFVRMFFRTPWQLEFDFKYAIPEHEASLPFP